MSPLSESSRVDSRAAAVALFSMRAPSDRLVSRHAIRKLARRGGVQRLEFDWQGMRSPLEDAVWHFVCLAMPRIAQYVSLSNRRTVTAFDVACAVRSLPRPSRIRSAEA
jgi:histone H3/H4